jgi:2-methylcitrate dehydratase
VFIRICRAAPLKERGWDQGFAVCIATAAAVGNLFSLSVAEIGHAISMSGVAHLPLRATKAGELSQWKGAATAHAARCALDCTLLAAEGVTGPVSLFEGRDGLWEVVTGPFELQPFGVSVCDYLLPEVGIKYWPLCGGLHAPVAAAMCLYQKPKLGDISSVMVETCAAAHRLNGSDPAKWDPQNRETADHSIPYAVVRTLADGRFLSQALEPTEFTNEAWRSFMALVSVTVAQDLDSLYPADMGARITIVDTAGSSHVAEVMRPPGHPLRPLSLEEIQQKFLDLAGAPLGGAEKANEALRAWSHDATGEPVSARLDLLAG